MASQRQEVVVAVLLTLGIAALASTDVWQRFSSSNHFSVTYPGTWFRIGVSTDRLQLLSSKGGAEGVVIKRGQAEIIVVELQGPATAPLSQLINEDTREKVSILSRRDFHNETAGQRGCSDLREVISKQEAVPSEEVSIRVPYIINTDFYCEINGRKFSTLLKNWEGDNWQERYQRVALRMAKSIRVGQPGCPIRSLP